MTITRIIKGPYRQHGYWWVDVECGGKIQHLMRRTEDQAKAITAGQEAV
ncbi:hypothetical protein N5D61_24445 [Pseudomonas sp. GD03842]|nr:hypothetical protein [Pseudomonas sp. GD03842]MDH0749478.1 hypothetical protein [Pseudomonas sp. GD03842]